MLLLFFSHSRYSFYPTKTEREKNDRIILIIYFIKFYLDPARILFISPDSVMEGVSYLRYFLLVS